MKLWVFLSNMKRNDKLDTETSTINALSYVETYTSTL
jgi:hypothetical protein